MRASPRLAGAAVTLSSLAAVGLTGCGGSGSATPSAAPLTSAQRDLARVAAASRDSAFVASYTGQTTGKQRTAAIAVFVQSADRYRVDVREGSVTTSLYATAQGSVACTVAPRQVPACFLVAKPGEAVPTQFDAGVQRVFTRDLPRIAANPGAFTVTEVQSLPKTQTLEAARCFTIAAQPGNPVITQNLVADVDLGTYCLSDAGPPRRLTFPSGTLTLTAARGAPSTKELTPPAAAKQLPSSSATASASPNR